MTLTGRNVAATTTTAATIVVGGAADAAALLRRALAASSSAVLRSAAVARQCRVGRRRFSHWRRRPSAPSVYPLRWRVHHRRSRRRRFRRRSPRRCRPPRRWRVAREGVFEGGVARGTGEVGAACAAAAAANGCGTGSPRRPPRCEPRGGHDQSVRGALQALFDGGGCSRPKAKNTTKTMSKL